MAVGAITKSAVDSLQSRAGRDEYLWDPKLTGFGLKATPAGSKVYLVQYRMGGRGAKTRRVTIGKHGQNGWTPDTARKEARRVLSLIEGGVDPQDRKRTLQREAVDLAFDKYTERFVDVYGAEHWKERTVADNRRYLTDTASAARTVLRDKPLTKITRSDIATVFDQVPVEKRGYRRNLYSALHRVFAWAVERGDIDRSPMEGYKGPPPVKSRDRVLSDTELRLAWLAATAAEYPFGPLYRLLIATGQRREEVAALDWRELDRCAAEWVIPGERAKNGQPHVVPLNALAISALDVAAGSTKWPGRGLVFSTNGKTPVSGYSKAKRRLDEKMLQLARQEAVRAGGDGDIEIDSWRVHDLRRTLATNFQKLGVRFEVTEAVLNHVSGSKSGIAGVYQRHDWRDEKGAALSLWGQKLTVLLIGCDLNSAGTVMQQIARDCFRLGSDHDNVVPIRA